MYLCLYQENTGPNGELIGIRCAKSFGAGLYKEMRLNFFRGVLLNYIFFVIAAIIFIKIDMLLIYIGFEPKSSEIAKNMLIWMLPSMFIKTFNES